MRCRTAAAGVSLTPGEGGEVDTGSPTGCGIAAQHLPRIFEPFFTTKPAGECNGLGLMVVKGIVTDHGGSIEASSTPGQGTEFHLLFPSGPRGAESAPAD
jgi:signal transduction histidine kinase